MRNRPEGDRHALEPEDDWFAAPEAPPQPRGADWFAPTPGEPEPSREILWEDEPAVETEPYGPPPGLGQRQLTVVGAALGIVAVIVVAILVVRAFGSDGTSSTPATTVVETTPAATTPTTSTPSSSTTTGPAATTPAATTPATTTAKITSVPAEQSLKPGMSGSSVLTLQQALVQLGYDPGTPDSKYGPATTKAVASFQGDNGLAQDGVAGPATLAAVNAALARG